MSEYLEFDDLTDEQIAYVWNGVGSDHVPIDPHDLIFKGPSKKHDFLYWLGGDDDDRRQADIEFYWDCKIECYKYRSLPRLFFLCALLVYCAFLFPIGRFAFEYKPKCKTWDEMKDRIDASRASIVSKKKKTRRYCGIGLGIFWLAVVPLIVWLCI